MFLKLAVGIQVWLMGVVAFAETKAPTTAGIADISTALEDAGTLVNDGGSAFNLVKYVIIFLGMIIMGTGINDTFIAEDRGGENKKLKGVMKMIGGALFIAISVIYDLFYGTGAS